MYTRLELYGDFGWGWWPAQSWWWQRAQSQWVSCYLQHDPKSSYRIPRDVVLILWIFKKKIHTWTTLLWNTLGRITDKSGRASPRNSSLSLLILSVCAFLRLLISSRIFWVSRAQIAFLHRVKKWVSSSATILLSRPSGISEAPLKTDFRMRSKFCINYLNSILE